MTRIVAIILSVAAAQAWVLSPVARGEGNSEERAQHAAPLQNSPAPPDDRQARTIERYLEALKARPVEGDALRSLAVLYDRTGRLDDLSARLDAIAREDAKAEWPWLVRGHVERWRGRAAEARAAYEQAIKRNPESYLARAGLARALDDLGRAKEAEAAWKDALARVASAEGAGLDVRDETAAICRALGRLAMAAGRADDARGWWSRLVALDPDPDASGRREDLAKILAENHLYDDAVKTLETVMARSAGDPDRRTRAAREIARTLDAAGRADEALAAYARALDLTAPGNWMRRQIRADVFDLSERAGKLALLERSLAGRVAKNPDDAEAWEDLLRVRERTGDREGTAAACDHLLRLRPDDNSLRRRRAAGLADSGAWKESAALWREVIRREPKDAKARVELARALKASGDLDAAAAALDAGAADFADAPSLVEIARALEISGAADRAERCFRRAAAASPDDASAAFEFAGFLRRSGRSAEAVRAVKDFAAAHARSAQAWSQAGRALGDWGETAESLAALRRAAELAPAEPERWKDFAGAALDAEQLDEAIAAWEEAARFAPSDRAREEAWEQVVTIQQSRDRLDEQVSAWRQAAEKSPDDERAVRRLGLALERDGKLEGEGSASAAYEEFLKRHPASRMVATALARLEALEGHAARAAEIYEKRLSLDPADARECLVELVRLYLEDEKPDLARAAARRLVEKFPFDPSARAELARAEEATGRDAEAAAAYAKALDLKPGDRALIDALARSLESAGESRRLVELHRRVLRSNPGRDACLDSVRALIRLAGDGGPDDLADLERMLDARLAQDRRDFTWYLALGEVLRAEEQPERIETLYREALDAAPASRAAALESLARLAAEVGDAAAAARWTEELRREQGLPRETLPRLASFYYAAGRTAEARRALDEWLKPDDRNPDARRFVADACLRHGDLEGALDALRGLVALGPAKGDGEIALHVARIEAAEICARLDRLDDATKLLLDVLDRLPATGAGDDREILPPAPGGVTRDSPPEEIRAKAVGTLVRVHLADRKLDALFNRLERRVEADPTRESLVDDLSESLAAAGETGRLVKDLERARKLFPNSFNVACRLARAYAAADRAEDASREFDAAAKLALDREASLQDERIELWVALGRGDDVRAYARRLIREDHDARRAEEAADRCASLGEFDLAASILDETIAAIPRAAAGARLAAARAFHAADKPDDVRRMVTGYLASTRPAADEPSAPALLVSDRLRRIDDAARVLGAGARDRMLEDLRAESAKAPADPVLLTDVAAVELRLGKYAEFARTCRKLMSRSPDEALAARVIEELRLHNRGGDARTFVIGAIDDPACRAVRARVALEAVERMSDLGPDEPTTARLAAALDAATPEEGVSRRADRTLASFYWSRGRREEAVRRLKAVVEKRPDDADATLQLAGWLSVIGAAEEAKATARRAADLVKLPGPPISVEPGRSLYSERRTQLEGTFESFAARGMLPALRERLAAASARAPDDDMAACDLAAVDERSGRLDLALDTLKKVLARRPADVSARLAVAETLQDLGRHGEAVAEFERAAATRPPRREIYDRWIEAKVRSGDRSGALTLRERTAAVFREPRLLDDIARDWRSLGMEDRALAVFRKYLRLQYGPSALLGANVTAAREYAVFLRQSGRCEPATRALERAIAVARVEGLDDSEQDALRFELAATWRAMGRLDELIRRTAARVAADPADAAAADFLATLHATRGDDARAVEVRRRIARSDPRDVDNLQQLAQALRRIRRLDEAIDAERRLLDTDPENAVAALVAVAEMQFEKGDLDGAVETAKSILLDHYAPRMTATDRLQNAAALYGRMGRTDLEVDALRRAIARTRGASIQARSALVRALAGRGDEEEAAEEAARAFESAGDDARRSLVVEAALSAKSPDRLLDAAERLERSETVASDPELAGRVEAVLHGRLVDLGRPDLAADVAVRMFRSRAAEDAAAPAARELTRLGRFAEAQAVLEARLREAPEDAAARLELARACLAAGRVKEGVKAVDDLLRRRPAVADRIEAAQVLADAGLWDSALARLDAAGGEGAASLELGELRAEALERTGKLDRAAEAWQDLLGRFPSERAFAGAGRFYLAAGKLDRAEAVLRELLRLDPSSLDGARMLGETLLAEGEADAAVEVWGRGRDAAESEWARTDFARRVERTLRETLDATPETRSYEAARALDDADAEWAGRSAEFAGALEAAGRRDEAAEVWRKLASLARDATMRQRAADRLKALEAPGPR